jgi:opacity protein-like surface antigen
MKKYLIVLTVAAAIAVAGGVQECSAQNGSVKPEKGSFALEVGFSPFDVEGNNILLHNGEVRGIYSISDKIGIRVGLGLGASMESDDNGQSGDEWTKMTSRATRIALSPGIVYSFAGTDKLSPYIGGEIVFATLTANTTAEGRNFKTVTKNEGDLFNTFGLGVFTGFNYYFAKNLYIGVEAGLSLENRSLKNMITETTASGMTETVELKNDRSQTTIGMFATPSLRLGWVF